MWEWQAVTARLSAQSTSSSWRFDSPGTSPGKNFTARSPGWRASLLAPPPCYRPIKPVVVPSPLPFHLPRHSHALCVLTHLPRHSHALCVLTHLPMQLIPSQFPLAVSSRSFLSAAPCCCHGTVSVQRERLRLDLAVTLLLPSFLLGCSQIASILTPGPRHSLSLRRRAYGATLKLTWIGPKLTWLGPTPCAATMWRRTHQE